MIKFIKAPFILMILGISLNCFSQKKEPKFGDVKASDFDPKIYSLDSSADGVVLFDYGSSYYTGDQTGNFNVVFTRHKKIRLLNKNAFDMATFKLNLYSNGSTPEVIEKIEACTYNLEGNKVVVTKLDKSSVFTDKVTKDWTTKKFTLPALKEGCIIEIQYRLVSPNERTLRPWSFQSSLPTLWSQYEISVPEIYNYQFTATGSGNYEINERKTESAGYSLMDRNGSGRTEFYTFNTTNNINKWAMKNMPATKNENYLTTYENYMAKIDFQLSQINYPQSPVVNVMKTWTKVSEGLLEDNDFAIDIKKNNGWLKDEINAAVAGAAKPLAKAKKTYAFIRDNLKCTDHSALWLSQTIKKTLQNKSGNVAEINMLLTAALITQGIHAEPVVLSTRDNGFMYSINPILSHLNYVICYALIDGKSYFLDASYDKLGFGFLHENCYNGGARLINKEDPQMFNFSADSVQEYKVTNAVFINDSQQGYAGSVSTRMGQFESFDIRQKIAKSSKEEYLKYLKKGNSEGVKITDVEMEELNDYEQPITLKYNASLNLNEDIIYISPLFHEAYKENLFKATERQFPIEIPYKINEIYQLSMEIPKGYKVEEMPKSTRVNLNGDEGMFEYIILKEENSIKLRSIVKLNKANYLVDDYQTLRDFFAMVVKKHAEQIVLKKIK